VRGLGCLLACLAGLAGLLGLGWKTGVLDPARAVRWGFVDAATLARLGFASPGRIGQAPPSALARIRLGGGTDLAAHLDRTRPTLVVFGRLDEPPSGGYPGQTGTLCAKDGLLDNLGVPACS